ncbi:MAG: hypothetical protein HKO68_10490 [Desulfobacterales bacterium]|nr:hypothetical protein [Desulfobacterales bacterium]
MHSPILNTKQIKDLLIKNWMTHDALWYAQVAGKYGMADASPMNLKVCRKLGQIEFKRLMKMLGTSAPNNMKEYQALFEIGQEVFVPDFMSMEIEYPDRNVQRYHVTECFAHRGMEKAGLLQDYECGIFERIVGWCDAMNLKYTQEPDLSRCLKYRGKECKVALKFHF